MTMTKVVSEAVQRLIDLARKDTGQASRSANFLLAWWNGGAWGDFPIADIFSVDKSVAADMVIVLQYLANHRGAVYPDFFGQAEAMNELVKKWRQKPE